MSWTKALGALGLSGKGEPVQFEFTLYIRTLSPWPSNRPPRRLALRWTRGPKARTPRPRARIARTAALTRRHCPATPQRHGNTRAVHPLYPDDDEPEDAPLTYEFKEQLHVPATLYKARGAPRGMRRRGALRPRAEPRRALRVMQAAETLAPLRCSAAH